MTIDINTVQEVAYKILLNNENGEMVEYADEDHPRTVFLAQDDLIPGFEKGLKGRGTGPFSFFIGQQEAFGPRYENLVMPVPKSAFSDGEKIREDLLFTGNRINMRDNNNRPVTGTVVEVQEESVVMDFNHPLAGKDLFVTGQVLSIRQALESDVVMAPDEGCGCGSGCGCKDEATEEEAVCETCGNPADKMGQGYGNCQCGS